jgi:CheY-like chemotaxis protein
MMKSIVVIDDDDDVRDVITFALENEGFTVIAYENGKKGFEGLQKMDQNDYPGLIIVDYLMPEMDGITFIKEIRSKFSDTIGKIPVAISSAMGSLDPAISAPKDLILLHKPMDLDDLIRVAKAHCS